MTLYSSQKPFNDDPFPYITKWDKSRHAYPGTLGGERLVYTPRAEFDRPQNNPTNPILAKLRTLKKAHWGPWIDGFMDQSTKVYFRSWDQDQVDHARKVLTRLANFQKEES